MQVDLPIPSQLMEEPELKTPPMITREISDRDQ